MRARQPAFTRSSVALAAAALMGSLAATPASAAVCTWNAANGNWNALANWLGCVTGNGNPGGVPGGADTAVIGSAGVVTVNTSQAVNTLNNAGQINIDAFLLTLGGGGATNTGVINVGGASTAALQVFGNVNNAGGIINVGNGSVINQFGTSFTGGAINTSGTGKLAVQGFSGSNFLNGVTLAGNMDMAGAGQVSQRVTGGLALGGTVSVGSGSYLNLQGTQTLSGNGSIVFADSNGNNRLNVDGAGSELTIGSGISISGHTGKIGQQYWVGGGGQSIVNNGSINASETGGTIETFATLTNNGTVGASNGGTLRLSANYVGNSGSQLVAGAGSTIQQNGATISGVVNVSGDFRPIAFNANNILDGVTLNGNMNMVDSGQVSQRVINGLALNGAINVGSGSYLNFQGSQTLSGNGSIVFADSNGNNRVNVDGQNSVLTIGANAQIRGQTGIIGEQYWVTGGGQSIVNNGRIAADVSGGTVTVRGGTLTNNNLVEALNGGVLRLEANYVGGASSALNAGMGSRVEQGGVTISGIVNASGDFRPTAFSVGNILDNVTLNGTLNMAHGTQVSERVTSGLALNGGVNIGSGSYLNFQGSQTLSGNGSIVFADSNGNNRVNVDGQNSVLTIGASAQIRGQTGIIGEQYWVTGGGQSIVNNGRIAADVSGGTVTVRGGTLTNNNLVEALNGGVLGLEANYVGGASSALNAGNGSRVEQRGVTISGIVNASGDFRPTAFNAGNFLDNVTLNGTLNMAHGTQVSERVTSGLVLNGGVNIDSGSYLNFQGTQTLSGNGSIVFADSNGNNRLNVDGAGSVLTIGSGISISGHTGKIGQQYWVGGGGQSIVNNGSINASETGGTIETFATLTNNGTVGASNGGTLRLSANYVGNSGSQLVAGAGSTIQQNAVTMSGVVNVSGDFRPIGFSAGNYLDGVTLNGNMNMVDSGQVSQRVINGLALNGAINIGSGSYLNFQGSQTLSGNGSIVFADGNGNNRLNVDGAGSVLTIGSGISISGHTGIIGQQYWVGGGGQSIVNNGTIDANTAGGTLSLARPVSGTGTFAVNGGTLSMGGTSQQGRLQIGSAGTFATNGGNLAISSDYTNAQAGSGNSFNRRAGVTGAGQIQAGGDVQQVISGAGVTGGNTNNATLTIGNVRVGLNNFDYTIGAGGTTGPAMRGAVQTNVNGANLTDGRLGGGGVTASNYNGGAPGGSGETRTVTFTAGSAGALAPMTGQVLNLRSTYDNIADQKLNIVLGANAAAYNAALGSAVSPVQVANQRVGGTNTATLAIRNDAAPGAFSEDLNASIASLGGQATGSGSVSGRLANTGNTGTGAITVGVDTSSAGAKTGLVNLNYQSAGTVNGVSNGLAAIGVGGQSVTVNGNVYQAATGQLVGNTFNFGTLQVGQQVSTNLAARNIAGGANGYVEDLNVRFGASGNGQISGSGSFTGIQAGATSNAGNGTMTVTVNGTTAGALNSSIAVNYFSAGAVGGVSNGLGELARGGENFGVNGTINAVGNVINQASPQFGATSVNLGAVRVGAATPTANIQLTNQSVGGQQAALSATIASNGAPVTASGAVNLLAPGASSSALQVGLNTAVAGNFTGGNAGSATVSLVSDASNVGNCGANCTLNLASQQITVQGKVYTAAVGAASGTSIDFGIVRVGDTVSARNITINNNAAASALNDSLRADVSGLSGPFAAGSVAGVAAQASGQIGVTLSTASAGVFNQNGLVQFLSQNGDMADISAGPDEGIDVKAQVNNLANAVFGMAGGMGNLSRVGDTFYLDYGNVVEGNALSSTLNLINQVAGPADELDGSFDVSGAGAFSLNGWSAFNDLTAGNLLGGLGLNYLAATLGSFQQQIVLNGFSDNASDLTNGIARTINLVLRGNVVAANQQVPEPGSLALVLLAAAAGWQARRRRTA